MGVGGRDWITMMLRERIIVTVTTLLSSKLIITVTT